MSVAPEEPPSVSASTEEEEWAPADGIERTLYTSLATTVIGVGFGLVLLAAMTLPASRIDARSGLAFGVAGFVAVALAPSLGLAARNSGQRRGGAWRSAGLVVLRGRRDRGRDRRPAPDAQHLAADRRRRADRAAAHDRRAADPHEFVSTAPAELAGHFVATSLAVTAIFWAVLGYASGGVLRALLARRMSGRLVLVLGGARSGKSAYAEKLVSGERARAGLSSRPPQPGDEEMAERIAQHRAPPRPGVADGRGAGRS